MFETVEGREIEHTVGVTSADPCLMSDSSVDKDGGDADDTVAFALDGANAVIAPGCEHWAWDKSEKVRAPLYYSEPAIAC